MAKKKIVEIFDIEKFITVIKPFQRNAVVVRDVKAYNFVMESLKGYGLKLGNSCYVKRSYHLPLVITFNPKNGLVSANFLGVIQKGTVKYGMFTVESLLKEHEVKRFNFFTRLWSRIQAWVD